MSAAAAGSRRGRRRRPGTGHDAEAAGEHPAKPAAAAVRPLAASSIAARCRA